jgi:hypothetical protein
MTEVKNGIIIINNNTQIITYPPNVIVPIDDKYNSINIDNIISLDTSYYINYFTEDIKRLLYTSTIKVPKYIKDTRIVMEDVMTDMSCAMKYINHFISPENNDLCSNAELSEDEKRMIEESIQTISGWDQLYNKGMQIAISENADIKFIEEANKIIQTTSNSLKDATSIFKGKLTYYTKN